MSENLPLKRFISIFETELDSIKTLADGILEINNVDNCNSMFLPKLAKNLGYVLDTSLSVIKQRGIVKTLVSTYKMAGTIPGLRQFIRKYTLWTVAGAIIIVEKSKRCFKTYCPELSENSKTLDPADIPLKNKWNDVSYYTYNPDGWHSLLGLAIYVHTSADPNFATKRTGLLTELVQFLPFGTYFDIIQLD